MLLATMLGSAVVDSAAATPAPPSCSVELNTSPSVTSDTSNDQWVYYVGANGQIYKWSWNGTSWTNFAPGAGAQAAANASPTALRDAATGDQWVYYVGANGQIYTWS